VARHPEHEDTAMGRIARWVRDRLDERRARRSPEPDEPVNHTTPIRPSDLGVASPDRSRDGHGFSGGG
jgi:hypothetical protein